MPRPSSIRRPTLDAFASEVNRILAKQRRAKDAVKRFHDHNPDMEDEENQKRLAILEDRAALSDKELNTLAAAARASVLLEPRDPKNPRDDDDDAPVSAEELAAMERQGPKALTAAAQSDDDDS